MRHSRKLQCVSTKTQCPERMPRLTRLSRMKVRKYLGPTRYSGTEQVHTLGFPHPRVQLDCFAWVVISFCFLSDLLIFKTQEISHKQSGFLAFCGKLRSVGAFSCDQHWLELQGSWGGGCVRREFLCPPCTSSCVLPVCTRCLTPGAFVSETPYAIGHMSVSSLHP